MELTVGLQAEVSLTVTDEFTAKTLLSGSLPVLGTPKVVALIEEAACMAVASAVPRGSTTVGTLINLQHLAPTLVDGKVTAYAELTEIDRRRLVFAVKVTEGTKDVAVGSHERFVVDKEKFMAKAKG